MGAQGLEKLGREGGKGGGEVVTPEVRADLREGGGRKGGRKRERGQAQATSCKRR